jgi:mono/diheme cytochrome c family protein
MRASGVVLAAGFFAMGWASPTFAQNESLPAPAPVQIDFARDIRPILETSCFRCHGPEKPKSGFRLDNRDAALKGGDTGVDIISGDSAKSPLIRYVAGLEKDMQMPPPGKGEPLTTNQIALLRAWIDQGVAWDQAGTLPDSTMFLVPMAGYTWVSGDEHKFREHFWQREGVNGGLAEFDLWEKTGPDSTFSLSGHLARDDYKLRMEQAKDGLGFLHAGWEQYRKYYDDTGGYDPLLSPAVASLDRDLHLTLGRAWVELGLDKPHLPRMSIGYEYQYRKGDEATLQWGNSSTNARNYLPSSRTVNEQTQILKFNLDTEIHGTRIEDNFRAEFYSLSTQRSNIFYDPIFQGISTDNAAEKYHHFQGANTLRIERQFKDWLFASAGYLYSKLDGDTSFNVTSTDVSGVGSPQHDWSSQQISLERESHVGNLSALLGPWDGLTVSTGVQSEWTRQQSLGNAEMDDVFAIPGVPAFTNALPGMMYSDLGTTRVEESIKFRYSKIRYTSLFAEGRLRQEQTGQFEQEGAGLQPYVRNTDYRNWMNDVRAGFSTSPWTWASLTAHYRRYDDDSHYNHTLDESPAGFPGIGYSAFIRAREMLSDEVEARLALRPLGWLRGSLSYKWLQTDFHTDTDPASFGPGFIITPGGSLLAGRSELNIYSLNAAMTPWRRLFFSTTLSWQHSRTVTDANGSPAVAPYEGDTYSAMANATFAMTQSTDLSATYSFSHADYSQDNFAAGLPVGIRYQQHALQAGLSRRFGKYVLAKLQYGFFLYDEPTSGGANNYTAHSILGLLTLKMP